MDKKTKQMLAAALVMLACTPVAALAQDHDHGAHDAAAVPAASAGERTPSPKGAEVYFHYPINGIRVPQRFTARLGLRGMGIAPAGVVKPFTGHHHLLIDVDKVDFSQPIPSDYNHIHLGNGQTEVVLTLTPGTHTLQLLMGDNAHFAHLPPVISRKITIYVR